MSDVPRAKAIIDALLRLHDMDPFVRKGLNSARALLERERPAFRARRSLPTMTRADVAEAIELRRRGWPLNRIARHLGTNIGRVSEAINGHRDGI
ncbi:MAG TPA: hypothetical protein VFR19_25375 [Hyphomicrobiaceae bacterium]|jgi:hypothetical protein|nr:hypothetical protein [Hyphomicrobiaceae bacterium]